jgi:hypothetical protein
VAAAAVAAVSGDLCGDSVRVSDSGGGGDV